MSARSFISIHCFVCSLKIISGLELTNVTARLHWVSIATKSVFQLQALLKKTKKQQQTKIKKAKKLGQKKQKLSLLATENDV